MRLSKNHPYRKHSSNAAKVKSELVQIERAHKHAIRAGDQPATEALSRLHMLLVGVLAEAFLRKIVSDPGGFNDREGDLIRRAGSQLNRWHRAVELAFRRHYRVPVHLDLDEDSLPGAAHAQVEQCAELLDGDLRPIIESRNKIAHGQWVWQLNSRETDFLPQKAPPPLNYRAIWARSKVIADVGDLISVLAVSEPTFQRDYDMLIESIEDCRPLLAGDDYDEFVAELKRTRQSTDTV